MESLQVTTISAKQARSMEKTHPPYDQTLTYKTSQWTEVGEKFLRIEGEHKFLFVDDLSYRESLSLRDYIYRRFGKLSVRVGLYQQDSGDGFDAVVRPAGKGERTASDQIGWKSVLDRWQTLSDEEALLIEPVSKSDYRALKQNFYTFFGEPTVRVGIASSEKIGDQTMYRVVARPRRPEELNAVHEHEAPWEEVCDRWSRSDEDESVLVKGLSRSDVGNLRNKIYRRFDRRKVKVASSSEEDGSYTAIVRHRKESDPYE